MFPLLRLFVFFLIFRRNGLSFFRNKSDMAADLRVSFEVTIKQLDQSTDCHEIRDERTWYKGRETYS